MRPLGGGRRFGPGDRPPHLLDFDAAVWLEPCPPDCSCDPSSTTSPHGYSAAHSRWSKARFAWADEHGVDPLEIFRFDRDRLFPNGAG